MVKITDIQPQKHHPERFNIYLDGEFGFGVARAIAPWLKVGQELDPQQISKLQEQDQVEQAYQKALHYLSFRDRSEAEIERHLEKKDISPEVIETVLHRLREKSLVDDLQFATQWIENRSTFRPRGKKALSAELYQKGISSQIINQVLEYVDEQALAYKLARKKLPRVKNLEWEDFRKKMYGYLSRKGFHYSLSKAVVQDLWTELQEQNNEQITQGN